MARRNTGPGRPMARRLAALRQQYLGLRAEAGRVRRKERAVWRKLEKVVGRKPAHLDSHQHAHRQEPLRSRLLAAGDRLGVPVRGASSAVAYCGGFYGQSGRGEPYPEGITLEAMLRLLDGLADGVTELSCHPGADDLGDLDSPYRTERAAERRVLCDARLPGALAARGIDLRPFTASMGDTTPSPALSTLAPARVTAGAPTS